jgi:hypothetical protein
MCFHRRDTPPSLPAYAAEVAAHALRDLVALRPANFPKIRGKNCGRVKVASSELGGIERLILFSA